MVFSSKLSGDLSRNLTTVAGTFTEYDIVELYLFVSKFPRLFLLLLGLFIAFFSFSARWFENSGFTARLTFVCNGICNFSLKKK